MNCKQNIGVMMISCSILSLVFCLLFMSTKVMLFFQIAKIMLPKVPAFLHFFNFFFSETEFSDGDSKNYINERKKYFEFLV